MPIICQFHLTRTTPIYYTGEHIVGSVTLAVAKKETVLESIKIALLGEGHVSWAEPTITPPIEHNDSTIEQQSTLIDFTNKVSYINEAHTLLGPHILPPNTNPLTIQFDFQLPAALPSTTKLPYAEVNYMLQVQVERRAKCQKIFKQRLIIKNRTELDANDLRAINSNSGTAYTLAITRAGYVPGQKLNYQLSCTHATPKHFVVRLCQCIVYRSRAPQTKQKRTVRILDTKRAQLHGQLQIPLTAPIMTLYGEELFQIAYFLEALIFERPPRHTAAPLTLFLPIKIVSVAPEIQQIAQSYNANAVELHEDKLCFVNFASAMTQFETMENSCHIYREIGNVYLPASSNYTTCTSANNSTQTKCGDHIQLLQLKQKVPISKSVLRFLYRGLL